MRNVNVMKLFVFGLIVASFVAMFFCLGCAATVGTDLKQDSKQVHQVNGSPVTLSMSDAEGQWLANGVGPARFTDIAKEGIQTIQTGTVPRDLFLTKKPDGTWQVNLSSGTDITAEKIKVDPKTGTVEIGKFGTFTSDPLKAHSEALAPLVQYWTARDQASKDVLIEQIKAAKEISTDLKAVIVQALTGM